MNRAWNKHSEWGNADSGRQTSHSSHLWLLALNLQVFMYVYKPCRYQGSSNPVLGLTWERKRTPCYKDLNENNGTGRGVNWNAWKGRIKKSWCLENCILDMSPCHVTTLGPSLTPFSHLYPLSSCLYYKVRSPCTFWLIYYFFIVSQHPTFFFFLFNLWARPAWQVAIVYEGITA